MRNIGKNLVWVIRPFRKEASLSSFSGQYGATLMEYMIALAIFGISMTGMLNTLDHISQQTELAKQVSTVYETDQMIRFELGTTFDQFQKLLIQPKTTEICKSHTLLDVNGNTLLGSDGQPIVKTPWSYFKQSQQNFKYSKEVYFGPYADLNAENIPTFKNQIKSSFVDLEKYRKESRLSKLFEAVDRCGKQTLNSSTSSIVGRSSFYVCGYGIGLLVEAKIAFWDFFTGKPLACQKMNENAGRGVQVVYTVYTFRPEVRQKKLSYYYKKYDSRLFIPKRVDITNQDEGRGIWDP